MMVMVDNLGNQTEVAQEVQEEASIPMEVLQGLMAVLPVLLLSMGAIVQKLVRHLHLEVSRLMEGLAAAAQAPGATEEHQVEVAVIVEEPLVSTTAAAAAVPIMQA